MILTHADLSGAFVMQEPEARKRQEAMQSKARFLTREGFRVIQATRPSEFRTHQVM